MFWKEEGTKGRKTSWEVGASGTGTSGGEEEREAIQETLRRENGLALAASQMGNSEAERSPHGP